MTVLVYFQEIDGGLILALLSDMRRVAVGLLCCVIVVVAMAGALRMQRHASPAWKQFSMAPASGESASISTSAISANGVTLRGAIATAYDMPAVRVIGPRWLDETRYSINAVLGIDESNRFRPLLHEELSKRLGLETHVEIRPFEVFVLTASSSLRLEPSGGSGPSTWIGAHDVRIAVSPCRMWRSRYRGFCEGRCSTRPESAGPTTWNSGGVRTVSPP
jgi:hypothetical protein